MDANSTISCNWLSATDVVRDIQAFELNVTDIVTQCADICQIVFQSNSLDIAEQGVRISYTIQVALACFTGCILPALFWLVKARSWHYLNERLPLLRKFRDKVWVINAFFSLSFLLAICIRYSKTLPVIEIAYLSSLINLELIITYALYFGKMVDVTANGQKQNPRDFLYMLIAAAQLIALCTISIPDRSVYQEIAKQCYDQHNFVDISFYLNSANGKEILKWYSVGIGAFLGGAIIIAILAKVQVFKTVWNMVPAWFKKHGLAIVEMLFLGLYSAAAIGDLILAEYGRQTLIESMGDQERNGDWGYGQTTAILIWFPVLWSALKTIKNWQNPPEDDSFPSLAIAQTQVLRATRQASPPPPPPYGSPKSHSRSSTMTSPAPPYTSPSAQPPPPQNLPDSRL